jgi:hypothetical protein
MKVDENPVKVGDSLHACIHEILTRVAPHAERFRQTSIGQTAGLYVGILADEVPPIELTAGELKSICSLGVGMEIDLL